MKVLASTLIFISFFSCIKGQAAENQKMERSFKIHLSLLPDPLPAVIPEKRKRLKKNWDKYTSKPPWVTFFLVASRDDRARANYICLNKKRRNGKLSDARTKKCEHYLNHPSIYSTHQLFLHIENHKEF
ncbi:hypothetical protein ISS03_02645 [Patescibacteria group bacterium]|nr:hypothetical protein [Patescibacteria group bacterium]